MTPQLLKSGVTDALVELLKPIQADFQASSEWQEIEKKAYPPAEPEKKKKKPKDKGSRYPGGTAKGSTEKQLTDAQVKAQPDGSVEGPGMVKVALGEGIEEAMEKLDVDANHVR